MKKWQKIAQRVWTGVLPYRWTALLSCLAVLNLFLSIALLSFHASDPSWYSYTSGAQGVSNAAGLFGAYVAAALFYWCGSAAYLFLIFAWYGFWLTWARPALGNEWDRALGVALLCVAWAARAAFLSNDWMQPFLAGGLLGQACVRILSSAVTGVPALILIHGVLLGAVTLIAPAFVVGVTRMLHTGCVFLASRERLWQPLWQGAHLVGYAVYVPVAWAYHWCKRLGSAADVGDSGRSVFEFESGVKTHNKVKHVHDDTFWHRYCQHRHHQGVPPTAEQPVQLRPNEADPVELVNTFTATQRVEEVSAPEPNKTVNYRLPVVSQFFQQSDTQERERVVESLQERARLLEEKLARFGVTGSVSAIKPGPVVTLFEYKPDIDTKISKIIALEDDLALALQAFSIRIIAPIPGRSVVGFEVANRERQSVMLADIINSPTFAEANALLPLSLGEDTTGNKIVVDLATMPHLLIAGSTGSGKSVALNAMLVSLLCRKTPDELRLILIDPKRLEFAAYADIAHLVFPIVTDPHRAVPVLKWVVQTMEERYEAMASASVRNIVEYNAHQKRQGKEAMPFLVVIIDELADLMMTTGKEVEDLITRLSQMARAAGIHLIVATQRPSVDVITGLIKANFPSRISFRVTSKVDSRTILDTMGAEKLLGRGDMLVLHAHATGLERVHGAYVSDREIEQLVAFIRSQRQVNYLDLNEYFSAEAGKGASDRDNLYRDVLSFLDDIDEVSISLLQRKFRIGYNRSARIIDMLETEGYIMSADSGKIRKVIRQ